MLLTFSIVLGFSAALLESLINVSMRRGDGNVDRDIFKLLFFSYSFKGFNNY